MKQIREKCKIPEDKMNCLNLTYRCKDPNTGTQMTLEGVSNSAFDAAVLCSAVQDKLKQRRRRSTPGVQPGKMSSFFSRSSTSSSSSSSSSGRDVSPEPERRSGGMFHRPRRVSAPPPETESSQNRRVQHVRRAGERDIAGEGSDEEEVQPLHALVHVLLRLALRRQ